jgi:DNA-binding CsgD family transcriptional regulator
VLVGRQSEQRTIGTLLAGARMGTSAVLVLCGEPGIGKTALLTEASTMAAGMRLLRAQGTESEQVLPFAGLLQVLRPVLDRIDRIPPAQRSAISSALLLGSDQQFEAREPNRFAIGAATLSLITCAAEDRPIAILLDDAHLIDVPSAEALIFAARRLGSDAVALLAAVRAGEHGSTAWTALPELPIAGVDLGAAEQLIGSHGPGVRRDQLSRLHRATAGNPLALLELRRHVDQLDAIPDHLPLSVSETLASSFLGRVSGLSDSARSALLIAAADNVSPAIVSAAARELDLPGPLLSEAEDADLITIESDRIAFRHPLVRSAVYAAADPARRRAVHRALATVLPAADVHRVAWHLAASVVDPDEATAATLEQVAGKATTQGAYAIAANAYERSAALSVDAQRRLRRLVAAAEAAWAAGQPDRTNQLLDRVLAAGPDRRLGAHVHELRGAVEARCGSLDRALATLLQAADSTKDDDPAAAVRLLADAVHVGCYLAAPGAARLAAEEIERLLLRTDDPATHALGTMATGMALVIDGSGERGAQLIADSASRLVLPDDLQAELFRLPLRVQSALWLRESSETRTVIGRAIDRLRDDGALGSLPYLLMHIGRDAATTDDWDGAESAYQEAIRLAGETGQTTDLAVAAAGLACVLARRGKADRCRQAIGVAAPIAERNHVGLASFWLDFARGDLDCVQGRISHAIQHYRRLSERLTQVGFVDPDQWCTPELVECLLQLGDADEAGRLARTFMIIAEQKGQPWSMARAERALALCGDDAEARFEAALGWHAKTADRYETARTELAYGSWLRRARRRIDARPKLTTALETFEQLGPTPWADRAAQELAATGTTVHRRSVDPISELTPQERQIAQLLAGGRTTREAAAALFLSPKTVEYHLRHVYLKLGIRSREELTERFGG